MSAGLDDVLWCIEQIRTAVSAREISGYILRIPDAIVVTHGAQLQAECVKRRFAAGGTFLQLRAAALHAVRDAHGVLPDRGITVELEAWRQTLSHFASGHGDELPGFMMEAHRVANEG